MRHKFTNDLVVECLEQIEAVGSRAVVDMCRAHPDHATTIRRRIESLRELGLLREPSIELPRMLGAVGGRPRWVRG